MIFLLAGIAAANYSHVKYFPSRAAYGAFYEIMLRVVNIASEEFAFYHDVQELVVTGYVTCALSATKPEPPTGSRSGGLVLVGDTVYVMQCTAGPTTWGLRSIGAISRSFVLPLRLLRHFLDPWIISSRKLVKNMRITLLVAAIRTPSYANLFYTRVCGMHSRTCIRRRWHALLF